MAIAQECFCSKKKTVKTNETRANSPLGSGYARLTDISQSESKDTRKYPNGSK